MTNQSTGAADNAAQHNPSSISLSIWNRVEKTNPDFTHPIADTGFTAIAPVYMIKRATEVFGPVGIGWGYEIVEEGFFDGGPLGFSSDGNPLGPQRVHILRLKFWYRWEGQRGEFEHFGQTPFVGLNFDRSRVVTDGDVKKKSLTDALTKCMSLVGIGSDVHMGMHDDNKYVSALICEFGSPTDAGANQSPGTTPPTPTPVVSVAAAASPAPAESPSPTGTSRRRQRSTSGSSTADASGDSTGQQGGLDLDANANGATQGTAGGSSVSTTDINMWLNRIKALGSDAIKVSKTTVLSIFSGDELTRVQAALDQRERELTKAT